MQEDFVIGIPTLNQYNRLNSCIDKIFSSSVIPSKIYIIDNGGTYTNPKVTIIKPESNLGVSMSWNILMRLSYPKKIIIMNDDLFVGCNTLEKMLSHTQESMVAGQGFSCFILDRSVYNLVGNFDENFYPGYFEDNDYHYRMKLLGFDKLDLEESGIEHDRSSTIRSFDENQTKIFKDYWEKSKQYYIEKWGGIPHEEKFNHPFNKNKTEDTLTSEYERVCRTPSDINEHCHDLSHYASLCEHVTHYGGTGAAGTISLLFGKPKKLSCYDNVIRKNTHILKSIAKDTEVKFFFGDDLQIEETDLLFIDNDEHNYESVNNILSQSNKVKKWIILHDTVTFGKRSPSGKEGILKAINELKGFKIKTIFNNNNGLIVLIRDDCSRIINLNLELHFKNVCDNPSDINEHCQTLRKLAADCSHITEMGIGRGNSTTAFLASQPDKLICYDLNITQEALNLIPLKNKTDLQLIQADVRKINIEETDLLFIDTWHVYEQIKDELRLHADKVKKYLVFHDTNTFGINGENNGTKGLWFAIEEFLEKNTFRIKEKYDNNNGLTILEKILN